MSMIIVVDIWCCAAGRCRNFERCFSMHSKRAVDRTLPAWLRLPCVRSLPGQHQTAGYTINGGCVYLVRRPRGLSEAEKKQFLRLSYHRSTRRWVRRRFEAGRERSPQLAHRFACSLWSTRAGVLTVPSTIAV